MRSLEPRRALALQRIVVALLLIVHGVFRATHAGYVDGFGGHLDEVGIPAGRALAYAITAFEVIGGTLLALGFQARLLAWIFAAELTAGIVMVHAPEGWFVVGGGRNGMEYSVLLIATLLLSTAASPRAEAA